jgi:hypothetical protein
MLLNSTKEKPAQVSIRTASALGPRFLLNSEGPLINLPSSDDLHS